MKFDPVTIVLVIVGLILTCISFIIWLVYEQFIKSNKIIKYKNDDSEYKEMFKSMNIRTTKLEDRVNEITKDIDFIKRKLEL